MDSQDSENPDSTRNSAAPGVPLPIAEAEPQNLQQYRSEVARLATFTNWQNRFISPADLANAGFIYTGDRDMVRCVFCGQYVGNWEEEDFPITEHR